MKNYIDILIKELEDAIQAGDGSLFSQHGINARLLLIVKEINGILKTCQRDIR